MADYSTAKPLLIVVMGPASCGKSSIGSDLANSLSIPFIDGDDLHPAANVAKMSAGIPLTDEDRLPWLQVIRSTGEKVCREQWDKSPRELGKLGRPAVVIPSSALKQWYRNILRGDAEVKDTTPPKMETVFVYCKGTPELLAERIAARKGHFMKPSMLASQLATLEDPSAEAGVVVVDISKSREEVSKAALDGVLGLLQ
ncbi:uncharacterized protein EHS24_006693 [Apiotrichum porosum]|uniref:Gluconokinase n=1 Tax=Apiotrichum porosum TaxID=105984 RepID=A0A427Y210_9TREE|nr:uncharacterized protein EHS24_006693 [Apiotrichum porosum]RSH85100.1 hypothetical protein EHS24_006693 [Apiotrichum porosum]